MKKADHFAINRAIKEYKQHCDLLRPLVTNDKMGQAEIFELIVTEVEYAMTLLSANLLEFGDKEN